MEVDGIELLSEGLTIKRFRRLSPSRYSAMQECLLREIWTASGNDPLLPPSPQAELGRIAHRLLEAAARGELEGVGNDGVGERWDGLVSEAEARMVLSLLVRHQVPLYKSIPDYQVRRLRACSRALKVARDAQRTSGNHSVRSNGATGFEVWVESDEGDIGGFIDRASVISEGVVLSDYKSGAILESEHETHPGELKRAYSIQMKLYAALYKQKTGSWPVKLEVIPLQGEPLDVSLDATDAECLLSAAKAYIRVANDRVSSVQTGTLEITQLAAAKPEHCRMCPFRPACRVYWLARRRNVDGIWPADVCGVLEASVRLRNGKICLRIRETDSPTTSCMTIRGVTDSVDRHPHLSNMPVGTHVAVYGLWRDYRSSDYTETQNTVIF